MFLENDHIPQESLDNFTMREIGIMLTERARSYESSRTKLSISRDTRMDNPLRRKEQRKVGLEIFTARGAEN